MARLTMQFHKKNQNKYLKYLSLHLTVLSGFHRRHLKCNLIKPSLHVTNWMLRTRRCMLIGIGHGVNISIAK